MQNRTSNFAVYQSITDYFRRTPVTELFKANLLHVPRNLCIGLSGMKVTNEISLLSYFGQSFLCQTLAYPFMLVQRRLEAVTQCQTLRGLGLTHSSEVPRGFWGMMKMTVEKEGVRGLYRGYCCYMVAIMFWMSTLPLATEFFVRVDPA